MPAAPMYRLPQAASELSLLGNGFGVPASSLGSRFNGSAMNQTLRRTLRAAIRRAPAFQAGASYRFPRPFPYAIGTPPPRNTARGRLRSTG